MKSFLAGLLGSILFVSILLNGYLVYNALRGDQPDKERQTQLQEEQENTADNSLMETGQASAEPLSAPAAVPVSVQTDNTDNTDNTDKNSALGFTGDTGGVWYQIGGFSIKEIINKKNVTTPGLYKKPDVKYVVITADYRAVNYSDEKRYFYIEDSWITDKDGRISGSTLSTGERKGALFLPGETRNGTLRFQAEIYDLSALEEIYLCFSRVAGDPVSGDITCRISLAD